jgi:hypothetical protein
MPNSHKITKPDIPKDDMKPGRRLIHKSPPPCPTKVKDLASTNNIVRRNTLVSNDTKMDDKIPLLPDVLQPKKFLKPSLKPADKEEKVKDEKVSDMIKDITSEV